MIVFYLIVLLVSSECYLGEISRPLFTTNVSEIEALLVDEHVVFIGDSITRYQYLALASMLKSGRPVNDKDNPNPTYRHSWGSWEQFYNGTSSLLYPFEICDCTRSPSLGVVENRYFRDFKSKIALTFFQFQGKTIAGRYVVPAGKKPSHPLVFKKPYDQNRIDKVKRDVNKTSQRPRMPRSFTNVNDTIFTWSHDLHDTVIHHIALMTPRPTILVVNAGLWPHQFGDKMYRSSFIELVTSFIPTVIWKTTTAQRVVSKATTGIRCEKTSSVSCTDDIQTMHSKQSVDADKTIVAGTDWKDKSSLLLLQQSVNMKTDKAMCSMSTVICLDLSWTFHEPDRSFVDSVHFVPSIYNAMNNQLLKVINSTRMERALFQERFEGFKSLSWYMAERNALVDVKKRDATQRAFMKAKKTLKSQQFLRP